MIDAGDDAPEFTVPLANGDIELFTLSNHLGGGPVVLAFFPAAFSGTCTAEMSTFDSRLDEFDDVDANVYGVSVDLPFALNEFRDQQDLSFGLLSDADEDVVDAYGVDAEFGGLDLDTVARRAVFVVDDDGTVTYAWRSDDPGVEPDYDEVAAAAADAA